MPPSSTLTGSWYGFILVLLASLLLTGAVASYSYASRFLLGPLEGVPLDATGRTISPQKPPVLLVPLAPQWVQQHPALQDENLAWRQLLQALGHPIAEAGPDWLPPAPSQFPVLLLPWGTVLSLEQSERLEQFLLAGGGVLLAGPALPEERLRRVVGIHPLQNLDALTHQHFFARVRASQNLLGRVLMPLPLRINGEGLQNPRGDTAFLAATDQPLVVLESEEGKSPDLEPATLLHRQRYGAGRLVWLGAPLSQLYGSPGQQRLLTPWLEELLPWLAGQPVVRISSTPGPAQQSVAMILEAATLHHLLPILERLELHRLPATLFLPVERLEEPEQDRLRQRLPTLTQLELGVLGSPKLSVLAPAMQRGQLLTRRFRLEQLSAMPVVGFLMPDSGPPVQLEALLESGYRYRLKGFTSKAGREGHPSRWMPPPLPGAEQPLVRLPVLHARENPASPSPAEGLWQLPSPHLNFTALRLEREPTLLEQWRQALPPREHEQLALLRLDVSLGQSPERLHELEELFEVLAHDSRYRVQRLSTALDERESLEGIEVLLQPVGKRRLHLRLVGGAQRVSQLRLHVQLPSRTQLLKTETHQPLASAIRHYTLGDETVVLEIESLAAGETVDYFLALESLRELVQRP
ncbi:MAG: hypothetical protein ACKO6N_03820 [Myxococcota bacterium]